MIRRQSSLIKNLMSSDTEEKQSLLVGWNDDDQPRFHTEEEEEGNLESKRSN